MFLLLIWNEGVDPCVGKVMLIVCVCNPKHSQHQQKKRLPERFINMLDPNDECPIPPAMERGALLNQSGRIGREGDLWFLEKFTFEAVVLSQSLP